MSRGLPMDEMDEMDEMADMDGRHGRNDLLVTCPGAGGLDTGSSVLAGIIPAQYVARQRLDQPVARQAGQP